MGLEAATYINGLVVANPVGGTDPKSQGDDHIRLIKSVLKATFPNITGAVTATHTELNQVDNANPVITFPVGTRLIFVQPAAPAGWTKVVTDNDCAIRIVSGTGGGTGGTANFSTTFASRTPAGTVNGTALTTAQLPVHSHSFSDSFTTSTVSADHAHNFSVNSGTVSAFHQHAVFGPFQTNLAHDGSADGDYSIYPSYSHNSGTETANHVHGVSGSTGGITSNHTHTGSVSGTTGNEGTGATHTHTFTGTAMDFAVKYIDSIICSKD